MNLYDPSQIKAVFLWCEGEKDSNVVAKTPHEIPDGKANVFLFVFLLGLITPDDCL